MKTFRCTRNRPYKSDTPGFNDRTARQGHYIVASSREAAIALMGEEFPKEVTVGFTADEWTI